VQLAELLFLQLRNTAHEKSQHCENHVVSIISLPCGFTTGSVEAQKGASKPIPPGGDRSLLASFLRFFVW
jgi:hypothetical protein